MKILGLDLGSKTIGIALSDALGFTAQGVETFKFDNEDYEKASMRVVEIVKANNVSKIVLGYPKNMNGSIGERALIVERFKDILESNLNIEIVLWDERLTTMQVERILIDADVSRSKRKKVVDKMAAVLILQSYLDFQK